MFKHPLLYVWIVLVAMFVAGGLIRPASEGPHVGQASTKAQGTEDREPRAGIAPAPAVKQGESQAKVYSANCDRPEDHDQADLCVQRRMADAAERQNSINSWALAALVATLIATFVAARAAWLTVNTMRDTAKRELRAYLNTEEANIADHNAPVPVLSITLKNFGQTPAYKVHSAVGASVEEWPTPDDFPAITKSMEMGTIGPSAKFTVSLSLREPPLSAEMRNTIRAGTHALYFFGRIDYRDAFATARHTNFRVALTKDEFAKVEPSLSICEGGNDAT